jgi:beta-glucosidase
MKISSLHLSLICVALLCTLALAQVKSEKSQAKPAVSEQTPAYRNPKLAIEDRVADLLSRMTLEEKVAQITPHRAQDVNVIDPTGTFTDETARQLMSRWWDQNLEFPPKKAAILRNGIQRYLREKTRLGIPQLFMGEALHGFMEYGSTSFPQALGLASTFDPTLVKQVFTAAGDEARATGTGQVFSPVLDLARDPRWGRTEETYGEDPYLVSRMAVAAVTGLQDVFKILLCGDKCLGQAGLQFP